MMSRTLWPRAVIVLAVVAMAADVALPAAVPSAPNDDLLARAGNYVLIFQKAMATAVMEERYVQLIKPWTLPPKAPDHAHLAWADDLRDVRPDVIVLQRRHTRSDVLFVHLPDQRWTAFRDTYEVNGRNESHREDRLRKLFLEQSEDSRRQLRRINERSAAWNLGGFYRDINLPTSGMVIAHPDYQSRFSFTIAALARRDPNPCRVVSFKETARPTLVQSVRGKDVPLRGQLCVDQAGVIWSTRLDLDGAYTMRGRMEVNYARHDRVEVLVPDQMWEWYVLPEPDARGLPIFVEALATYSNLRQFTVTTGEIVKP